MFRRIVGHGFSRDIKTPARDFLPLGGRFAEPYGFGFIALMATLQPVRKNVHQHHRTRYSTFCISIMPRQLLISLLLVVTFSPRPLHGQLKAETKLSPLEVTTENSNAPPASSNKTIAVVLRKSLDASKLKAGETYIVEGGFSISSVPSISPIPCCTQTVMRVINASPLYKNSGESRISLRFEPLHPDPSSGQKPILHLEIQAIASPSSIMWSPSLVIVDRFPCDPKVSRNGCDKPNENDPESRLDSMRLAFCDKDKSRKSQTTQSTCASQADARGVYGYPDLSFTGNVDGTSTTTITSAKKNVKLEAGTYLVLTGPDIDAVAQPHP